MLRSMLHVRTGAVNLLIAVTLASCGPGSPTPTARPSAVGGVSSTSGGNANANPGSGATPGATPATLTAEGAAIGPGSGPVTLTHARRRSVFGASTPGLPSRFLNEIPPDLADHQGSLAAWTPSSGVGARTGLGAMRGRPGSWGSGGGSSPAGTTAPAAAGPTFRMGEDVVHAAFGDGVVTGVEPGGIVVVRFAVDGSERKLMAEYAPIQRRA